MHLYRIFLFSRGAIVGREDFRATGHEAAIRMGRALLGACWGGCECFDLWQGRRRIPVERCYQGIPLHELPGDLQGLVMAMAADVRRGSSRAA